MKIPLFDIDGTLFTPNSTVSDNAFSYAVKKTYGIEASPHEINLQGMVDNQITVEILKLHGLTENEITQKIEAQNKAVVEYGETNKKEIHPETLPGVLELLRKLKERKIPIGLLTGNVEGLAWFKLEGAGIKDFFDFGAFGNMAFTRVELVEIAIKNAEKALRRSFKTQNFVIIGDTPRDIQCAKDAGIKVIVVATGLYSFEELKKYKPDLAVHTLEESAKILDFLNN